MHPVTASIHPQPHAAIRTPRRGIGFRAGIQKVVSHANGGGILRGQMFRADHREAWLMPYQHGQGKTKL